MSFRSESGEVRSRGFTLLEMLVVLAVIAALASLVAPEMFRHVGDARMQTARSQIEYLGLALDAYRLDLGQYPSTELGLVALRSAPSSPEQAPAWRGPYLKRAVPLDPWGRPYTYISPGRANPAGYDLYSLGRDGRAGGSGEDGDVTSWGGPVSP